jgi:hypothetical protein
MHAGIDIGMKGEGKFVMYCSEQPTAVAVDGVQLSGDDSEDGWVYSDDGILTVDIATSALQKDVCHLLQVTLR